MEYSSQYWGIVSNDELEDIMFGYVYCTAASLFRRGGREVRFNKLFLRANTNKINERISAGEMEQASADH